MFNKAHPYESDDDGNEIFITIKGSGRVRTPGRVVKSESQRRARQIAASFYSFTYKQTTGSLLNTRLTAMQRSLQSLDPGIASELVVSKLLTSLEKSGSKLDHRLSIPLDDHIRQTDEEMLEFLTVPYLDISSQPNYTPCSTQFSPEMPRVNSFAPHITSPIGNPVGNPLSPPNSAGSAVRSVSGRPPSMLRRASSMVLNQTEVIQHIDRFPPPVPEGIPTPLQPSTPKQASGQAVFTTSSVYPFSIKTLNDIACMVCEITSQDAQTKSLLEFVSPHQSEWLSKQVLRDTAPLKTKVSGDIIEINSHIVSLWVEESRQGVLMWVVEEVPCFRIDNSTITATNTNDHVHRVPSDAGDIILRGSSCCWAPQAIGAAIILDSATLHIIDYNHAALNAMLGLTESVVGKPFVELVPQFADFWPHVEQSCRTPGIVVPEHQFRHLAGIPYRSPEFVAPNPSRNPQHSIRAVSASFMTFIDLQLRVVTPDTIVAWIGYSHSAAPTTVDILPRISSVMAATPPHTPMITPSHTPRSLGHTAGSPSPDYHFDSQNYADLENVKVGENRRTLKYSSFEVLKLLGRGAYGEVHLVRTPSKRHVVVLKSIYKNRILVDTWSRDRVLGIIPNEIKILNQLKSSRHPNIVQMIDFFEDEQCYYLEMYPFGSIRGLDLFDFIETQSGKVTPHYLLGIWCQIASAVAHIHSLGIAHRDLKDENVIMDSEGNAKLIDFGSAAYVSQGPFDVFVGTVDYAAPEVIKGEPYEGRPQDAWALGILLYIMMFKEPPFNGADEITDAIIPSDMSCLGDNIIKLLLLKDPNERPMVQEIREMIPSLQAEMRE